MELDLREAWEDSLSCYSNEEIANDSWVLWILSRPFVCRTLVQAGQAEIDRRGIYQDSVASWPSCKELCVSPLGWPH